MKAASRFIKPSFFLSRLLCFFLSSSALPILRGYRRGLSGRDRRMKTATEDWREARSKKADGNSRAGFSRELQLATRPEEEDPPPQDADNTNDSVDRCCNKILI
jgi:hypothetical protein